MKWTLNLITLITILLISCESSSKRESFNNYKSNDVVSVEYPEVYELANIIIALTEDGITDEWKVQKDFPYYIEMRQYFEPMKGHPLLDSVNFVRERWKKFLSFRTDAYAFQFDESNMLNRTNDFYSFEISEFDDHIKLVQDFAEKSNFREFFGNYESFRNGLIDDYKNNYLLNEMKEFLSNQFSESQNDQKFIVVLSPFVGSQHLQRQIDSMTTASFINVSSQIINGDEIDDQDKSTLVHTLFTEMDHAFVNPTSDKFEMETKFNETIWDDESGYSGGGHAVFNEYMTWAVFDIFNTEFFPHTAEKVNLNWHFQNDTRGFIYSNLFATKLKELHAKYEGKRKISELFPEMLEWTQEIQAEISKPKLINSNDTLKVTSPTNTIELKFTEQMEKVDQFEIVLQFGQWNKETVRIGKNNNLKWSDNGDSLTFEVQLPNKEQYYLLLNWWAVEHPLKSKKGVTLQATSGFIMMGSSEGNPG